MSAIAEILLGFFRRRHYSVQPKKPASFPVPDAPRLDEIVDHYLKHRALAAILYQAGGWIYIKPTTVARMRAKDRILIQVDDTGTGGFYVRLSERPPREFMIQERPREKP